jgi:hypothetical protein
MLQDDATGIQAPGIRSDSGLSSSRLNAEFAFFIRVQGVKDFLVHDGNGGAWVRCTMLRQTKATRSIVSAVLLHGFARVFTEL